MSEEDKTVGELKSLLGLLPGVSVESTDTRSGKILLVLVIEEMESIGPVAYAAQGANILMDMWTTAPRMPIRERSNPAHMRYAIYARNSVEKPNAAMEGIQFFGVYLVWYLQGIGELAESEANLLLDKWGGARVVR